MKPMPLLYIIFITLISGCSSVKSSPQENETFYTPKNWQEPLESNPPKIVKEPPQQVVKPTKLEVAEPLNQQNELASWYGFELSKELTASGETYDQEKLTAAHDLLPMDTWVEVTNLKNDKKVIVRINDRGVEKKNHIIKLTRKAASQLDFLEQGTTPVSLKVVDAPTATETPMPVETPIAIEPPTSIEPSVPIGLPATQNGDQVGTDELFVVQMIVSKSEQNARTFQKELTTKYSSLTFLVEEYKDSTYRVFAGPYKSKEEAQEVSFMLRDQGMDTFVQKYKK
jgi:rare lipoprotein A